MYEWVFTYIHVYIKLTGESLYHSEFGCKNSSKLTTFTPKMKILNHSFSPLKVVSPANVLKHKAKKGDISPKAYKVFIYAELFFNEFHFIFLEA